ncbi:MAG: acyltransferase [Alphaproteobacteria bacterium]|nr:MAG: acyltransferase [Alphaproteobacteria bacterium]
MGSKRHMQYVPALDGVRAVAVFLVMLSHVGVPGFTGGGMGVDVFFVLSGFLITTLLLEEMDAKGRINVLHFYARRLLRLYPALLLMLLLFALFFHILRHVLPHAEQLESAKDIMLAALYLTDYAIAFDFQSKNSLIAHTWSLAVEEHFYLIWPWLLPLLSRACKGKKLIMALLGMFVAATAWKFFCLSVQPWEKVYFRFDTRMAGLILGALLAVCKAQKIKIPGADYALALSGIAFFYVIATMPSMEVGTAQTTFAEVFSFFLINKITDARAWRPAQILAHKIPVFLGRISYALYLFHFPVAALFLRSETRWWIGFEVTLAVALALAWFSWKTVERVGRLKAKAFRPSGAGRHVAGD